MPVVFLLDVWKCAKKYTSTLNFKWQFSWIFFLLGQANKIKCNNLKIQTNVTEDKPKKLNNREDWHFRKQFPHLLHRRILTVKILLGFAFVILLPQKGLTFQKNKEKMIIHDLGDNNAGKHGTPNSKSLHFEIHKVYCRINIKS